MATSYTLKCQITFCFVNFSSILLLREGLLKRHVQWRVGFWSHLWDFHLDWSYLYRLGTDYFPLLVSRREPCYVCNDRLLGFRSAIFLKILVCRAVLIFYTLLFWFCFQCGSFLTRSPAQFTVFLNLLRKAVVSLAQHKGDRCFLRWSLVESLGVRASPVLKSFDEYP